jgi:hypothetical protein
MLERYIRLITRFNVYLDAIVEKREIPTLAQGVRTMSRHDSKRETQTTLRLISCRLNPLQ